jgi:hypothetical protein
MFIGCLSACHPCRKIWVQSRLCGRPDKNPRRKNSEAKKNRGSFKGAIRIPLDSLMLSFTDLALRRISGKSSKFRSPLFRLPTALRNRAQTKTFPPNVLCTIIRARNCHLLLLAWLVTPPDAGVRQTPREPVASTARPFRFARHVPHVRVTRTGSHETADWRIIFARAHGHRYEAPATIARLIKLRSVH